jgi:ABC-2 type transport system permease protein
MAAVGAITTSQREAGQGTFLVTLPAGVPMWFFTPIIENPEGAVARVLSFIPFSAPAASMVRLGVEGMDALDLVISLGLLAATVAGAMWLTVRLSRAYLLMYGQRPGLKQIFSTLRAG